MRLKDADVSIKVGPDDGLAVGEFTAYASVFGNVDSYGDRVQPGAFKDTLAEWSASGAPIPLLWGHNLADPDYNIGQVLDATEDEHGLLVHCQIDMDAAKGPATYRLVKGQRVRQMSFAYDVIDGETSDDAFDLKKVKLYEVSVVPIGANQETEILAVKATQALEDNALKAQGYEIAKKHLTSLRKAQEAIGAVIAAAEGNDQEKASTSGPVKDEDPVQVKSDEPIRGVSVDTWATELDLTELENAR